MNLHCQEYYMLFYLVGPFYAYTYKVALEFPVIQEITLTPILCEANSPSINKRHKNYHYNINSLR